MEIYATKVTVEAGYQTTQVRLEGVDLSEVVEQFRVGDVLDCIDFDSIAEYYSEAVAEREES